MAGEVKHFFVLMLENRSFDEMLGRCGVPGVNGVLPGMSNADTNGAVVQTSDDAPNEPVGDPKHEYLDVQTQLFGTPTPDAASPPTMNGFVVSGGPSVMQGFTPKSLPILNQLASEFVVCDNWHASMPGPTWPNRFFVHAGSSGGLDNSPSPLHSAIAAIDPDGWWGFKFANGTIYDRLNAAGLKWRVYHGDHFPQVLAIQGLVHKFVQFDDSFRFITPDDPNDAFANDVKDGYDVAYTFIEPNYGILCASSNNSQHPKGFASAGENLIKHVYETIRSNPEVWNNSVLVITYDEHGGFFDHAIPQSCTAPGDAPLNHGQAQSPQDCEFNLYGVRVPAIIVSPHVGKGPPWSEPTDHTTILSTLREIFPVLGEHLTNRDLGAALFAELLKGPLRGDTEVPKTLDEIAGRPGPSDRVDTRQPSDDDADPPDATLRGFTRIAADVARACKLQSQIDLNTVMTQADTVDAARSVGREDLVPILEGGQPIVIPKMETSAQARDFIQSVVQELKRVRPK